MGPIVRAAIRSGAETVLQRLPWLFEIQYWLVSTFGPTRRLAQAIGIRVGGPGLLRLAAPHAPDLIVSTYPGTTQLLGRLRAPGQLRVPCASAVTGLAALRMWAHPG